MSVNSILPDLRNPWFFVGAGAIGNGPNPVAAVPAGYQAGDLLILMETGVNSISAPGGWTTQTLNSLLHLTKLSVFTKIAGGSEGSVTITVAETAAQAVMLCYRNISATPLDVAGTIATVLNNVNIPTNVISSIKALDLVVSFYSYDVVTETWTPPANTNVRVQSNSNGTYTPFLIVDEVNNQPGNTTSRTGVVSFTSAGTGGGCFALAFTNI